MNPRISAVATNDDYSLILEFTNGEKRRFDVTPLLNSGVFAQLRDITLFRRALVSYGTVVWPGEIDICPDTLYSASVPTAS